MPNACRVLEKAESTDWWHQKVPCLSVCHVCMYVCDELGWKSLVTAELFSLFDRVTELAWIQWRQIMQRWLQAEVNACLIALPFSTFFPGEAREGRVQPADSWACQHADIGTLMFVSVAVLLLLCVRISRLRPGWSVSQTEPQMVHLCFKSWSDYVKAICWKEMPASPEDYYS